MPLNFPVRARVAMALVLLLTVPALSASAQTVSFRLAPSSPLGIFPIGSRPVSVAAADLNGDGRLDLAVANVLSNTVSVFLGQGNGTFTTAPNITVSGGILTSSFPTAVAVGDFNGDGRPDLAVANIPFNPLFPPTNPAGRIGGGVAVLLRQSNGSYIGPEISTGGDFPAALAAGDFNGDAKLDLAVTNLNSGNVSILLGDGSGTSFSHAQGSPFAVGARPSSVAVADLDGDGRPDLAVANTDDDCVAILMGQTNATFTPNATSPVHVGIRPVSVVIGDFDQDGHLDLAAANLNESKVAVSLGDGTGGFPHVEKYGVGRNPRSLTVADFNNDGKQDLVVANSSSDLLTVLAGNGNGTFKTAVNPSVGGNPQSVAVGDFDGNHQPDLAAANLGTDNVTVLLNTTDITPPATTATFAPARNVNGWNSAAVTVTLNAADNTGGSGVKQVSYQVAAGSPIVVAGTSASIAVSVEGSTPLTFFATDNAGNVESAQSIAVQIDKTLPTISSSQSPSANAAGWNKSDVTVTFACADALSGIEFCTSPVLVNTDGTGQIIGGLARDRAYNIAVASRSINLDKTLPTLAMPSLAASYVYNASLTLTFGASDALSGLAGSAATFNGAPVVSGTTLTLNRAGLNTFTLTAADRAGNTATQTATFTVLYNFGGFLPPVPNNGSGVFRLGSIVPIRFTLTDANGVAVSTATARLSLQLYAGGSPVGTPIDATPAGAADTGDLFRFGSGQYVFNLNTTPLTTGTWEIQIHLDDGTVHSVAIGLK